MCRAVRRPQLHHLCLLFFFLFCYEELHSHYPHHIFCINERPLISRLALCARLSVCFSHPEGNQGQQSAGAVGIPHWSCQVFHSSTHSVCFEPAEQQAKFRREGQTERKRGRGKERCLFELWTWIFRAQWTLRHYVKVCRINVSSVFVTKSYLRSKVPWISRWKYN